MNNILERLDMASDNLKTIQQPKHNHAISPTGPKNNEMQNQASVLHNKITTTTVSSANTSHNSTEDPHHIPKQTNSRNNFKEASARINGSENATALQAAQTDEIDIKQECDAVVVKVEEPGEATHDSNNVGVTSTENLIFAKPRPILLSSVNLHIICHLCKGYLIDATTIVECLHSFCHSCLIKHLRMEQYCPRCEMMINTAKPNIKPDTTLQAIVYKLVPGLYERELMRKRAFYKDRPEDAALATPEQRGDDTEHLIFSPSDYMSLSLEYADIEEHIGANSDYSELLKPRYLRCPAMYTVGLLKKFVHGKFNIDPHRFRIDIMYKVKTIVLLDHYTLMDVAYIYTWKRDDPMRFYFRVKHSLKPMAKLRKPAPTPLLVLAPTPLPLSLPSVESIVVKEEKSSTSNNTDGNEENTSNSSVAVVRTIVHQLISHTERDGECMLLPPEDIKVEDETDLIPVSRIPKKHESLDQAKSSTEPKTPDIEKLVLPNNFKEMKENCVEIAPSPADVSNGERKVENIKLKIDLSKQNSVTIINMSDPQRKEITKPVKPDKEWKVKNKKERASSSKCTPNNERKHKTASPLTVPPLTIKAEQISPKAKSNSSSHNSSTTLSNVFHSLQTNISEEEKKSKFLMSFALTPIKNLKLGTPEKQKSPNTLSKPTISLSLPLMESKSPPIAAKNPLRTTASVLFKSTIPSKRKSKEPVKTISKKAKLSPPLSNDDFKIKLPPAAKVNTKVDKTITSAPTLQTESSTSKTTTLATSTPSMMRPPVGVPPKKSLCTSQKGTLSSVRPPQSMQRIQIAAPGNRTPIAKRYQPILPKTVRLNPFANIPSDVNKILKDAGTEIKTIVNNAKMSKVYGPKTSTTATTNESTLMGPPPLPPVKHPRQGAGAISPHRLSTGSKSTNSKAMSSANNYLNMALYNSTKSKGNEVPPGCRTPIYTPNSPIYSPSSPQYVPSYTIPTVPTYKYTPKPTGSNNSNFLQNVLGGSSQLANLFPAPPTKKEDPGIASACHITPTDSGVTTKAELQPKRVYPFARSPSPAEDPPEKQLKVKSLLTSCNINIPSSLSITITREDVETQSNSQSHPKHKSPVNNYIEILKLPDHPAEHESGRRTTPPTQKTPTAPTPEAIVKKNCSDVKSAAGSISAQQQQTTQKLMQRVSVPSSSSLSSPTTNSHKQTCTGSTSTSNSMMSVPSCNSKAVMLPRMKNTTTTNLNTSQKPVSEGAGNVQKSNQKISQTTGLLNMQHSVQLQNQQQEPTKQANATQSQVHDKKTPSPEKRPVSNFSSSPVDKTKLPSNPNASTDAVGQVGKKFRPILPRQEPIPLAEVVPPKVTTANVIGTYSAPSGVAVKVHANKKVSPPKKSPSSLQQQQQHQMPNMSSSGGSTQKSPRNTPSPLNAPKSTPNTNTKSPPSAYQNNSFATSKTVVSKATSVTPPPPSTIAVNALNKLLSPHPTLATLPTLPPAAVQAAITSGLPNITPHLGVAAATSAAVGQVDFNKFLKDNLLRAQVQAAAAAASQPVMFYPYPNGTATAAQLSHHYSSSMYQQAYMIEQLTRMQRAEALSDYMQKLKHGLENSLTPTVESGRGNNKVSPASLPSSPKATAESGATPPKAVSQDQSTSTVKKTFSSRSK